MTTTDKSIDVNAVDALDFIPAEDLDAALAEEHTLEVPVTLFGFITLQSALELLAKVELESGDFSSSMRTLDLREHIDVHNSDIKERYLEIDEYVKEDRVDGVIDGSPVLIPEGDDN